MKKMYVLFFRSLLYFLVCLPVFPQTLSLFLDAGDGCDLLAGDHGDFSILSTLSTLSGESVCYGAGQGSDLWQFSSTSGQLVIHNHGADDIVRIDLEGILYNGVSGRSALVTCTRRMEDENSSLLVPLVSNNFTTTSGGCVVYGYETPFESGGVVSYPRHFTFSTLSVSNGFPCIQRLWIYTNKVATSLEESSGASLSYRKVGERIVFDEEVCAVMVYTISGAQVYAASRVRDFSLEGFPSGVYILKAVGRDNKSLRAKVVK